MYNLLYKKKGNAMNENNFVDKTDTDAWAHQLVQICFTLESALLIPQIYDRSIHDTSDGSQ